MVEEESGLLWLLWKKGVTQLSGLVLALGCRFKQPKVVGAGQNLQGSSCEWYIVFVWIPRGRLWLTSARIVLLGIANKRGVAGPVF